MTKNRALEILETIGHEFPGLIDGETEVNGADLVDHMTQVMLEVFPHSKVDTDKLLDDATHAVADIVKRNGVAISEAELDRLNECLTQYFKNEGMI